MQGFSRLCPAVFPSSCGVGRFRVGRPFDSLKTRFPHRFWRHFSLQPRRRHRNLLRFALTLYRRRRQHRDLRQHAREQPPRKMTFRQQQPVVARMLDELSTGLDQPLLQADQRPVPSNPLPLVAIDR